MPGEHEVTKTSLGTENRGDFLEKVVPELKLEVRATEGRGWKMVLGELRAVGSLQVEDGAGTEHGT